MVEEEVLAKSFSASWETARLILRVSWGTWLSYVVDLLCSPACMSFDTLGERDEASSDARFPFRLLSSPWPIYCPPMMGLTAFAWCRLHTVIIVALRCV